MQSWFYLTQIHKFHHLKSALSHLKCNWEIKNNKCQLFCCHFTNLKVICHMASRTLFFYNSKKRYCKVASSRPVYCSILELFGQRLHYISIKFFFISVLKIIRCATNWDVLLLATLLYPICKGNFYYCYDSALWKENSIQMTKGWLSFVRFKNKPGYFSKEILYKISSPV